MRRRILFLMVKATSPWRLLSSVMVLVASVMSNGLGIIPPDQHRGHRTGKPDCQAELSPIQVKLTSTAPIHKAKRSRFRERFAAAGGLGLAERTGHSVSELPCIVGFARLQNLIVRVDGQRHAVWLPLS